MQRGQPGANDFRTMQTTGEVQGEGVDLAMSGPLCSPEISEKSRSSSNDGAVKRRHPLHHAAMCAIQKVCCLLAETQDGAEASFRLQRCSERASLEMFHARGRWP
eukprot:747107-Hanusia_phi.AAC.4